MAKKVAAATGKSVSVNELYVTNQQHPNMGVSVSPLKKPEKWSYYSYFVADYG